MTKTLARTFAKASGLLLFVYVAIFVVAHASGYYFRLGGGPLQFETVSGRKYALFDSGNFSNNGVGWDLYQAVYSGAFLWKPVPAAAIGSSFNDLHRGTDLVPSPDRKLLFVRRNIEAGVPIWSDVLDLTVDPPKSIIRGPDCCMQGPHDATTTDQDGLKRHGLRVKEFARSTGAAD